MRRAITVAGHVAGSLLFGMYLLTIWACDFEFDVSVGGKGVDVSATKGTADSIAARLRVGGKECKEKSTISGIVGTDGCITIKGKFCGQDIDRRICGFQPNSEFQYTIEIDGGGIVVLQVPMRLGGLGSWTYVDTVSDVAVPIEISDAPFGYRPLQPFVAQPGYRIVYARYAGVLPDSIIAGDLVGALRQSFIGMDTVKFIVGSLMRVRTMPGGIPVFAADSDFVAAEFPDEYDFARVGPPFAFGLHFVDADAGILSSAEASALGLPGTHRYAAVTIAGALEPDVDSSYVLARGASSVAGSLAGTATPVGGPTVLLVRFERAAFNGLVDTTSLSENVTLTARLRTSSYPWRLAIPLTLVKGSGVDAVPGAPSLHLRVMPNPVRGTATIAFACARTAVTVIELFDARGVRVRRLHDALTTPGSHVVALDAGGLAPGAYVLQMRSAAGVSSIRVEIIE